MELLLRRHLCFSLFMLSTVLMFAEGQTRIGYYSRTCSNAEKIVRSVVTSNFRSNPTIAPGLLRMHFHDCFVRGCDASILIDGNDTEKTAGPNLLLRGFSVIDDAKSQLERACPGVVSCADILALAARDSVVLTGGATWQVPTGRRDGLVSQASSTSNLPSFRDTVEVQLRKFGDLGLDAVDLVALVGGHTIGTSACQFFSYRLYNFTANGGPDPTIDSTFLTQLQRLCPIRGDGTQRVPLDAGSSSSFDNAFFTKVARNRAVLESDQRLWSHRTTNPLVRRFTTGGFQAQFGRSMVKMSNIGVLTGRSGQVRRVCTSVN